MSDLEPGQLMEDGTVYAGALKDGSRIFTTPADLGTTVTFNEAAEAFNQMNADKAHGHDDWRMPTKAELKVLRNHRRKGALKGSFRTAGKKTRHADYHWSSTPWPEAPDNAYTYRFSALPSWSWFDKEDKVSARAVRVAPPSL